MKSIVHQRAIIDRRELVAALDAATGGRGKITVEDRAKVLALFKHALKVGREEIHRRFEAGGSGSEVLAAQTFLADQLIRTLYDFAFEHVYPLANPTSGERQSVVAVGGYGRGEMAPFSDLDLLFLMSYKTTPHTDQVVEYILYMLWDMGLKVGHATRSIKDCMRMAKEDVTVRTALLEARYIWGDNALYAELRRRFADEFGRGTGVDFVEAKLSERDERHVKMGDSRYLLEPNIKDGKGGLRDLQTLYWIAKYLYRVDLAADLVDRGVFTAKEAALFDKAREFLSTLRCHLHYLAGRAEERLTFDLQTTIAGRMGFADRAGAQGVERFMKRYFLVAKDVGDLTRIFCAALEAEHRSKPLFSLRALTRRREIEGFSAAGGRLNIKQPTAFADDPLNILRLFHVAQESGLDIHPAALRSITQNLARIGPELREDPEANRLFMDMLTSRKDPATTLKRMNEAGVFGRFIPDFGRVVGQMQYDMYHVYTVDEHTIRAIDLLHRIEDGKLADDHPLASEIFAKAISRRALYVAVLLHDVAKGRAGDHSSLGAEIAQKLGPRLGLSDEETETVSWLIRQHLVMSNTAQKRDIDDPKTISDFVDRIQSPERLRLLLVLTVADMRATGPHVWNGWKAALLRDLYYRSEELMLGAPTGEAVAARVRAAQAALGETLDDWSEAEIAAHVALGYPSYWLSLNTAQHAHHARLVRRAEREDKALAIDTRPDVARAVTEVTVHAPDHPGLFSLITGGLALAGASIVDAKIFTLTNGKVLDVFTVQGTEGGPFERPDQIARLVQKLEDCLTGRTSPASELSSRERQASRIKMFSVPPRVLVDNKASATHTVVEVNGRDRPGLLFDVTETITRLGLQISSAKISTFGERVVDVFYVKDVFGLKIEHEDKIEEIRTRLLAALEEEAEEAGEIEDGAASEGAELPAAAPPAPARKARKPRVGKSAAG